MLTIDELIRHATEALRTGNEEAVLPRIVAGTRSYPRAAPLWQVLGLLYRSIEKLDLAADAFHKASSLDPSSGRIAHGYARVTMEGGRPSLSLFDRALQLSPGDKDLLLSRSAAMLAEGKLHIAIEEFDYILKRNPHWIAGHTALAQLRWLAGATQDFTASFDRALASATDMAALWIEKIDVLIRAEQFGDALIAVQRAQKALGRSRVLDIREAICASETSSHARAEQLFLALAPFDDTAVAVRYVRHLLRTGRIKQATELSESLVDRPDSDHVWPYLSVGWRMLGDPRWQWLEGDPRFIGVYNVSDAVGSMETLVNTLRTLHTARYQPSDQSVRGGTQTDGPLFARIDPDIRAARAAVMGSVKRYLDGLPPVDPAHPQLRHKRSPVRFAGSWSVRLAGGGRHSNHVHPQGFVSSAMYVSVPPLDQSGPPPAGHLALGQPPEELGIDLPPIRTIQPQPGLLVLFPSTMWHGTLPFGEGERLTIAFDVAKPK